MSLHSSSVLFDGGVLVWRVTLEPANSIVAQRGECTGQHGGKPQRTLQSLIHDMSFFVLELLRMSKNSLYLRQPRCQMSAHTAYCQITAHWI